MEDSFFGGAGDNSFLSQKVIDGFLPCMQEGKSQTIASAEAFKPFLMVSDIDFSFFETFVLKLLGHCSVIRPFITLLGAYMYLAATTRAAG